MNILLVKFLSVNAITVKIYHMKYAKPFIFKYNYWQFIDFLVFLHYIGVYMVRTDFSYCFTIPTSSDSYRKQVCLLLHVAATDYLPYLYIWYICLSDIQLSKVKFQEIIKWSTVNCLSKHGLFFFIKTFSPIPLAQFLITCIL